MNTLPELKGELENILHRILIDAKHLEGVLDQEFQLLQDNGPEDLSGIVNDKIAAVERLRDVDGQRHRLFLQADIARDDVITGLNQIDQPGHLATLWNNILNQITQCQQKNQRNGLLINRRSLQMRETLNILFGQDHEAGMTYDSQGQAAGPSYGYPRTKS